MELARASADDGSPLPVSTDEAASLDTTQQRYLARVGTIETRLVVFGPLASAFVVRGPLGREGEDGRGRFVCGADESNTAHPVGVWGEVLGAVDAGVRPCQLPSGADDVYLVARYD